MNAAYAISRLDWAIGLYGQSITLQREIGGATGETVVEVEVTCPAAVRPFGPQDLEAGEVVDIRVVVSPTGLGSFDPKRDDRLLIGASTNPSNIVQIERLYYGNTLCRVNILCRG